MDKTIEAREGRVLTGLKGDALGALLNRYCTDLGPNSFSQIDGIFQPLLATGGRRVHRAGSQVGVNRCWRATGGRLARPEALGTLLLGHRVLKHALINWRRGDAGRKTRCKHSRVPVGVETRDRAGGPSIIHGMLALISGCEKTQVVEGK